MTLIDAPPATGLDPDVLAEMTTRVGSPDFDAWENQVRRTGACSHPIRLHGRIWRNGELVLDTNDQPDGVLLKACGNRRASVCPSCSWTYRGDTWQMLHAGMVGGKGVPESVASHPAAFVTLTAPSFGAVHGVRQNGPCRRRGQGKVCRHGRPLGCPRRHNEGDPVLGQPLCLDCYDHTGHVLFNWHAGELWRRFVIALRRHLAADLNISERALRDVVRVSYAKVAEFQTRAIVHFHALIRLDGPGDDHQPPPPGVGFDHLERAVRAAAGHAYRTVDTDTEPITLRFGAQVDVRAVNTGLPDQLTGEAVAAYISKYATKGTEDFGLGLDATPTPHVTRLIAAGRRLAATVPGLERMEDRRGTLFFFGHFSTKSRRYSVTLGSLRAARKTYQRRAALEAQGRDPDEDDSTLIVASLRYVGRGYTNDGDAALAASIAARTRENRELARQERAEAA